MKIKKSQLRKIIAEEKQKLHEFNSTTVDSDGNIHRVTGIVNRDGTGTATIRFGNSFTLRLEEPQLESLRNLLHDTLLDLIAEK